MYLREINIIKKFTGYLKLNSLQKKDVQSALAVYYTTIRTNIIHDDLKVITMIKEDLIELEKQEEYEACQLYLDTIEYIEYVFDGEIQ